MANPKPLLTPGQPGVADTLRSALELLELGLWPVAIHAEEKRPVGNAWGLKRAAADELHGRFKSYPRSGVGICLGPGRGPEGTWLVDVEGDGPEAEASKAILFGGEEVASRGWSSARGAHMLLILDEPKILRILPGLKSWETKSQGQPGVYKELPGLPGLEFRLGGYKPNGVVKQVQSVAPPTVGTDGRARTWTGPRTIAMAPDSFYATLARLAPAVEPKRPTTPTEVPAVAGKGYGPKALADELKRLRGAPVKSRNDQLNLSAFRLGQLVAGGSLDRAAVETALAHMALAIGLEGREIPTTIASAMNAGMGQPRGAKPKPKDRPALAVVKPPEGDEANRPARRRRPRPTTDLGNGERMVRLFGDRIKYVHSWKKWLIWDGARWKIDNTAAVARLAKRTVRSIYGEAKAATDDGERKRLSSWAIESEARPRIEAMMVMASREEGVAISHEVLDTHHWLLNCKNGTIDLRTGELRPHDRADLLTKVAPVRFDPAAQCPLWDETLALFFGDDAELISYWQRITGYSITGVLRDHILPIAYGKGSNGKSTILETLLEALGPDYSMKAPPDLLMVKHGNVHPTERADLFGMRVVIAIETEDNQRLSEALVKHLTGDKRMRARRMHEDNWEFDVTHTIFLGTNYKPKVRGTDRGIWRRLKLIPFTVTMPDDKAKLDVPDLLKQELPGILAWLVRGCLAWQAEGLKAPRVVTKATDEYREAEDILGGFISEHCILGVNEKAQAGELYACYKRWAEASGHQVRSLTDFGKAITERGFEKKRSEGIKYLGLRLRHSDDLPFMEQEETDSEHSEHSEGNYPLENDPALIGKNRGESVPSVPSVPKSPPQLVGSTPPDGVNGHAEEFEL